MTLSVCNPQAELFGLGWPNPDEALAFARGASGAAPITWRPGAPSAGNVFATWAEVDAALLAAGPGLRFLFVDTTLGTAVIPAGAYASLLNVIMVGRAQGSVVSLAVGVTLSELPLELWHLTLISGVTGTCYTTAATSRSITLRGAAAILQTGTGIFCDITAAVFNFIGAEISAVQSSGAGAGPVFRVANVGNTLNASMTGSAVLGGTGVGGDRTVQGAGVILANHYGAAAGLTPQNPALFTGTVQWLQTAAKFLMFAGVLTTAAAAAGAYATMGDPADAWLAAAPLNWPVPDVRRWQRLIARVVANAAFTGAVTLDWHVNGAPIAALQTIVPAGSPGGTIVQGPRQNTSSGTAGATAVVDVRASGAGGGGSITLQVAVEHL